MELDKLKVMFEQGMDEEISIRSLWERVVDKYEKDTGRKFDTSSGDDNVCVSCEG